MYNIKAPKEIDITDIKVPIHLPNKIPETINMGDPKPNSVTQITANTKKNNKLIYTLFPIKFSKVN